jgi:hypothetical protein
MTDERFTMRFVQFWFLLLTLALVGCGEPELDRTSDVGQIDVLVGDLNDATRTQESFAKLFAAGAAPADAERKSYAKYTYRSKATPSFDDSKATMNVAVRDVNDAEIAALDWQFVREGDQWRLSSAPLPR